MSAGGAMNRKIPNSLVWIFETKDLVDKKYLKDMDFMFRSR